MKIIKTVHVKQILTEQKKSELLQQLKTEKEQFSKELEQLKFQLHKKIRGTNSKPEQVRSVRTSFQKEIKKREEKIKGVDFKIHQLKKLPFGTELKDGTVQSIVEINVGDKWDELFAVSEIIIEDGVVTEIREGRNSS